jgi:hypothetical protein
LAWAPWTASALGTMAAASLGEVRPMTTKHAHAAFAIGFGWNVLFGAVVASRCNVGLDGVALFAYTWLIVVLLVSIFATIALSRCIASRGEVTGALEAILGLVFAIFGPIVVRVALAFLGM